MFGYTMFSLLCIRAAVGFCKHASMLSLAKSEQIPNSKKTIITTIVNINITIRPTSILRHNTYYTVQLPFIVYAQ